MTVTGAVLFVVSTVDFALYAHQELAREAHRGPTAWPTPTIGGGLGD